MVQYLIFPYMLCISGELLSIDSEVVAAFKFSIDAKLDKNFKDWFGIPAKIDQLLFLAFLGKGKTKVPEIMKHSPATRQPAHYFDILLPDIINVDLCQRILMLANDNGRGNGTKHINNG